MSFITIFIIIYATLSLSHIGLQLFFAVKEHKKQRERYSKQKKQSLDKTVNVIIPFYNENPELLKECIDSSLNQTYPKNKIKTYVVNDGSDKNIEELNQALNKYKKLPNVEIITLPENRGKRNAQYEAIKKAKCDIIVTIDSDTIISENGIEQISRNFDDPKVGAATGEILVKNRFENLLTRLIHIRYWNAFHQERAAQSYFEKMVCCSGPFSAYRKNVINKIKEQYINQKFLGKNCTFGDDRHLTNLILNEGYKVRFDKRAKALTYVPTTFTTWIKQQVRWSKSFYRELLWTSKFCPHCYWYMNYDIIAQTILPFMLLIGIVITLVLSFTISPYIFLEYILIIIFIAYIRSIYGLIKTKDKEFLLFPIYAFLHTVFLVPVRLYALCTLKKLQWGTR